MSYYQSSYPGAPPPNGYYNQYPPPPGPEGYQMPGHVPPMPSYSSYPGAPAPHQAYLPPPGPSPSPHAGYSPSYLPPPPSQSPYGPPQGYGHPPGAPPPPAFSSYPGHPAPPPAPSSYPGHSPMPPPPGQYPQQSQMVYYLNAQIPAPIGYELPPQGDVCPGYDPAHDIDKIRKATKGFGTDEAALIAVLGHLGSLPMASLSAAFKTRTGKNLADVMKSEASGYFGEILHGLVLGPLWYDVELLRSAVKGAGSYSLRSTTSLCSVQNRDLQDDVRGDLSAKTERLYTMILSSNPPPENVPVDYQQVDRDVTALYKAGQGKFGTDEIAFCDIIVNRSKTHLAALCDAYGRKYKSLTKVIKSEFSGHMKQTLLFIVDGAKPKHAMEGQGVWRDAKLLEKSMKGLGTKDKQLVRRIVRYHWDRPRFEAIKAAYHKKYKKSLEGRVAGETSGDYKRLLVTIVKGP